MTSHPPTAESRRPGLRALLVGTVGAAAIGAGVPYCNMVLQGSRIASYFNTPAAIILFFFLVLVANAALGLMRRSWMLSQGEMALIYIMWIVATAIPEFGLTQFLLPDITALIYFATPENNWEETLLPFVPEWIIPDHRLAAIKGFYEGVPAGTAIPWDLWARPLAYWTPFVLALYLAMISVMSILRKQWVDQERLIFPLVQLPLAMTEEGDGRLRPLLGPLFRSPLMWLGFAVPAVLQTINGLNPYFPHIPRIYWGTNLNLFGDSVSIPLRLSFQMLGFSYFINKDIALGLVFFYLLNTVQQGIFNTLGLQEVDPVLGPYSSYTGSIIVHQGFGAMMMLVLFGLWTARRHLKGVWLTAIGRRGGIDDSGEIMSYRAAVLVLAASLLFMGVWLWQSGLPGWIVPLYIGFAFLLFIGITRVVAEGGIAFIFAPMIASDFLASGLGTRALGGHGVMAMAFTYVWASDILTFVMAAAANGLKLASEAIVRHRRIVLWGMLAAIVATLVSSVWAVIHLAYKYGGINTDGFFFNYVNRLPFDNAAARLQQLEGPHWDNLAYTGAGAAVMGLLMTAQKRGCGGPGTRWASRSALSSAPCS